MSRLLILCVSAGCASLLLGVVALAWPSWLAWLDALPRATQARWGVGLAVLGAGSLAAGGWWRHRRSAAER